MMDLNSVYKDHIGTEGVGLSGSNIGAIKKIDTATPATKEEVLKTIKSFLSSDPDLAHQFERAIHYASLSNTKTNAVDHLSRFLDLYFDSLKYKHPKNIKEFNSHKKKIEESKKELDFFLKDGKVENKQFVSAVAGFFVSLM